MVVAIVVASIAGAVAIGSLIASVCSYIHFKKKFSYESEDKASVDIENVVTKKHSPDGSTEVTKKQIIHIDKVDIANVQKVTEFHKTIPNETATKVGTGAVGVLGNVINPVPSEAQEGGLGILAQVGEHVLNSKEKEGEKHEMWIIESSDSEDELEPRRLKHKEKKQEEFEDHSHEIVFIAQEEEKEREPKHKLKKSKKKHSEDREDILEVAEEKESTHKHKSTKSKKPEKKLLEESDSIEEAVTNTVAKEIDEVVINMEDIISEGDFAIGSQFETTTTVIGELESSSDL